jgi:hypothetical protein
MRQEIRIIVYNSKSHNVFEAKSHAYIRHSLLGVIGLSPLGLYPDMVLLYAVHQLKTSRALFGLPELHNWALLQ